VRSASPFRCRCPVVPTKFSSDHIAASAHSR
jgi:hypothetical protein